MTRPLPSAWPHPPRWLPRRQRFRLPPPAACSDWLDEAGSLTARLQRLAAGRLQVRVRQEGWARPTAEERRALSLPNASMAWIREVELGPSGATWVQARSVLPRASLTGLGRRLTRLGNRSLGALLFRDPALRRGIIHHARLPAPDQPWARRSLLILHGRPVLVAEAFLPALWAAASRQPH